MERPSRAALERAARLIAHHITPVIERLFGRRVGFALVLFDFSQKGYMAYISNAKREGMVELVREWLGQLEAGLTTGPNVEG